MFARYKKMEFELEKKEPLKQDVELSHLHCIATPTDLQLHLKAFSDPLTSFNPKAPNKNKKGFDMGRAVRSRSGQEAAEGDSRITLIYSR